VVDFFPIEVDGSAPVSKWRRRRERKKLSKKRKSELEQGAQEEGKAAEEVKERLKREEEEKLKNERDKAEREEKEKLEKAAKAAQEKAEVEAAAPAPAQTRMCSPIFYSSNVQYVFLRSRSAASFASTPSKTSGLNHKLLIPTWKEEGKEQDVKSERRFSQ